MDTHTHTVDRLPQQGPGLLMMVVGLVCLFLLLLPLDGESPGWPSYAHVSVNQKLIAAFALGEHVADVRGLVQTVGHYMFSLVN